MLKKYSGRLYCFSPPVMLFTFLFEFGSLFYVLWRYKTTTTVKLVSAILLCLAIFQLAEYMICGGLGLQSTQWARFGYISITVLPVLGIHLAVTLAGKKAPVLVGTAYATMAAFATYFVLSPDVLNAQVCRPNYAVFDVRGVSALLYTTYYGGWLFTGVVMSWRWASESSKQIATSLRWLTVGYLVFMVPAAVITLIDQSTISGMPSIMCGFAIVLAVILVLRVLPHIAEERVTSKNFWRLWQS